MTSDFSDLSSQIRAAADELHDTIAEARVKLDQFERENQPTEDELRSLHDAALRGELGRDMAEAARLIDDGRETWPAVFTGESPHSELLRGHLERMIDENREAIRTAIEEDDEFDPFPPDDAL